MEWIDVYNHEINKEKDNNINTYIPTNNITEMNLIMPRILPHRLSEEELLQKIINNKVY